MKICILVAEVLCYPISERLCNGSFGSGHLVYILYATAAVGWWFQLPTSTYYWLTDPCIRSSVGGRLIIVTVAVASVIPELHGHLVQRDNFKRVSDYASATSHRIVFSCTTAGVASELLWRFASNSSWLKWKIRPKLKPSQELINVYRQLRNAVQATLQVRK